MLAFLSCDCSSPSQLFDWMLPHLYSFFITLQGMASVAFLNHPACALFLQLETCFELLYLAALCGCTGGALDIAH